MTNEGLRKFLTDRAEAQKIDIDARLERTLKLIDSLPDGLPVEIPAVYEFPDAIILEWPKVKGWQTKASAADVGTAERTDVPERTTVIIDAADGKVAIAFRE